jgi:DNA-binding HxlR family transcriptional regulator
MTNQAYGQFCGLARAVEIVGEPWALLVLRDLIAAPKSFADLREGLPRIPGGVLSARLEELEQAGVLRHSIPLDSAAASGYELTEYGRELEDIIVRLGRWGARAMGGPRQDEIVTVDSMTMALRSLFRPEAARGPALSYLLQLGPIVLHALIDDGRLDVGTGPIPDADLVIEAGPGLRAMLAGEVSAREAIETGAVRLTGDPILLAWFIEIFHIPPLPPSRSSHGKLPAWMVSRPPVIGGQPDLATASR